MTLKPGLGIIQGHRNRRLSWLLDRDDRFGQLVASFVYPEG